MNISLKLDPRAVRQVYTGKPGCACGCRGNYSENPATIKKVIKKIEEATAEGVADTEVSVHVYGSLFCGEDYGNISVEGLTAAGNRRVWTAYLRNVA